MCLERSLGLGWAGFLLIFNIHDSMTIKDVLIQPVSVVSAAHSYLIPCRIPDVYARVRSALVSLG
jgi:hypothetical protein